MKRLLTRIAVLSLVGPMTISVAHGRDRDYWGIPSGSPGLAGKPYGLPPGQAKRLWRQGERIPMFYIAPEYFIVEPRAYGLDMPPRGHRWIVVEGNAYLVQVESGMIAEMVVTGPLNATDAYTPVPVVVAEREDRWRQRYAHTYTASDDSFYKDCHQSVDPAGVITGAVVGGVLGNAVGHGGGRTGATVVGVVLGGAVGAALTSRLDCQDRSYAYKTYADGFNAGRPNSAYRWRNPSSGHYGEFQVGDYYNDPDGFRCARYTQKIYIEGRPQAASGRACQQPDGSWAVVS